MHEFRDPLGTALPRLVLPGIPYHVTQRGNRREQTFFEEADYALYLDPLAQSAGKADAEIWCDWPDAEPRPHHPRAQRRARTEAHLRRHPPALHRLCQCALALDGAPVAGPVRRGGDGRGSSRQRGPLRPTSFRCVRSWSSALRTGDGRASGRTSPERTTMS